MSQHPHKLSWRCDAPLWDSRDGCTQKCHKGLARQAGDHRICIYERNICAHFFVGQKLTAAELIEALPHLLAKPRIVVHVLFHKLADVFLRAAIVLRSDPINLCLQISV